MIIIGPFQLKCSAPCHSIPLHSNPLQYLFPSLIYPAVHIPFKMLLPCSPYGQGVSIKGTGVEGLVSAVLSCILYHQNPGSSTATLCCRSSSSTWKNWLPNSLQFSLPVHNMSMQTPSFLVPSSIRDTEPQTAAAEEVQLNCYSLSFHVTCYSKLYLTDKQKKSLNLPD